MECAAPFERSDLACDLYATWAPVLTVAGVLGLAALLAGAIGFVAARR